MEQQWNRNRSWTAIFGAAALGAAAMFLSDPERGKRRRALIKDKARRLTIQTSDAINVASRDLGNRMQGLRAQGKRFLSRRNEEVDDQVVTARVRERLGRTVTHPHAIKVGAQQGCITLSGPVLAHEKERLLNTIRSVPGVAGIDDQLTVHQRAEGVTSLQGGRRLVQARFPLMQDNWSPSLRAIAILGGGALGCYGLMHRSFASRITGALGIGLAARGMVNRPLWSRSEVGMRKAIDLHKTLFIEASPEKVFDVWSKYDNFPRFMSNVQQVQDLGNGRSHWVVSGPAGSTVEWDATLTESRRPGLLAWRSEPDSTVSHEGRVRFEPANGGTRVTVDMSYSPPAGEIGQAFASLFNGDPRRQMSEDLMRMKTFIESGIPLREAAVQPQREIMH